MIGTKIRRALGPLTLFCVLSLFVAGLLSTAQGKEAGVQVSPAEQYPEVFEVIQNIERSIGDGRTPPEIVMGGKYRVAAFLPDKNVISVDPDFYKLCKSFKGDMPNALAVVFGHELAHCYRVHNWVNDFGNAYADLKIGQTIRKSAEMDEVARIETEADDFGGFYSYQAGYDNFQMAPKVLEAVYRYYQIDQNLNGYPSLKDRMAIAERSRANLQKFIPVFEAGNRLLILKKYGQAAQCFDFIARTFPSREILNNAGVARALAALELASEDQVRYAFPFEIDPQTRLSSVKVTTRGFAGDKTKEYQELLGLAKDKFEQAKMKDPAYAPAYVNLACVYSLQGEPELAAAMADKGIKVAEQGHETASKLNGTVAKGIFLALGGDKDGAKLFLTKALKEKSALAELNLQVLDGELKSTKAFSGAANGEKGPFKDEVIGEFSTASLAKVPNPKEGVDIAAGEPGDQPMSLGNSIEKEQTHLFVGAKEFSANFVYTKAGFGGSTARGIHLGSAKGEVEMGYGRPSRMVPTSMGNYWVYEKSRIAFLIDPEDKVKGWMIYSMEE